MGEESEQGEDKRRKERQVEETRGEEVETRAGKRRQGEETGRVRSVKREEEMIGKQTEEECK